MKIVEVEWIDSTSYGNEWLDIERTDDCFRCLSIGYLLGKDKEKITLLQSIGTGKHGGSGQNKLLIPNGCIKKIKTLR